ncbi:MAG: hypothetical protein EBZ49_17630 [Proteobacteria bacterium]|nr:hypothetical protein [Pseudomonadota bacterium]
MAWWLILVVMVIYGAVGFAEALRGNWAMVIVWWGYSISNIGLAWIATHEDSRHIVLWIV